MSWVWIKLLSGIIFVLVPGFALRENIKKHPYLTILSTFLGLMLLYLSVKPLIIADQELENIKNDFIFIKSKQEENNIDNEKLNDLELLSKKNEFLLKKEISRRQIKQILTGSKDEGNTDNLYSMPNDDIKKLKKRLLQIDQELEKMKRPGGFSIEKTRTLVNELGKIRIILEEYEDLDTVGDELVESLQKSLKNKTKIIKQQDNKNKELIERKDNLKSKL